MSKRMGTNHGRLSAVALGVVALLMSACGTDEPTVATDAGVATDVLIDSGAADAVTADGTADDVVASDTASSDATSSDVPMTPDTGAPDAGTPDAGTADSGPSSDAGTKPPIVQCASTPPVFPTFDTSCKVAADCAVILHQVDCCGSFVAAGVSQSDLAAYQAAEKLCEAQFPQCKCMAQPTKADDGKKGVKLAEFGVDCLSGVCKTLVK